MSDSFPTGSWAAGSPGDPELDAVLPAGIAESMLDGQAGTVPTELRPLGEALAALRAVPSATEFRGEAAALAAFRSMHGLMAFGPARTEWTAGPASTVPLEILPDTAADVADRRPRRSKHAAPRRARLVRRAPAVRRPPARLSAGRRLGLATAAAAALVVIMGIVAYSGHLPEPIQGAAHVVIGAPSPSTPHHATTRPTAPATGVGRLSGSSATPAARPTPTAALSGSAATTNPRQWCQAYFKNPWRPGSRSWDMADFAKLAKAAGGSRWVLRYCFPYLTGLPWSGGHDTHVPNGFDGGSWAWTPTGQAPGKNPDGSTGAGKGSTGSVPGASSGSAGKSGPTASPS
jgi:hypothetical protein